MAELTIAVVLYTKDAMWTPGGLLFMRASGRSTDRMVSCPKEMDFTSTSVTCQENEDGSVLPTLDALI